MYYIGECFQEDQNKSLTALQEWSFVNTRPKNSVLEEYVTVVIAMLGLILNVLSIVVFLKLYCSSSVGTKNNIHIFFVFLSVSEVVFTITTSIVYMFTATSKQSDKTIWLGPPEFVQRFNRTMENTSTAIFYYNLGVKTSVFLHALGDISNDLTIIAQFSRNVWVALTAMLRCYVATRRVSTQLNQLYSIPRITGMYFTKLLFVSTCYIIYKYFKFSESFLVKTIHMCNTSTWQTEGTLILMKVRPKMGYLVHIYNICWIALSQLIPLVLILISSAVLVISLHQHTMANSSERNRRITRLVFIFAMTFALLEGPRGIWYMCASVIPGISSMTNSELINNITFTLTLIDSLVNVFIYFFNDPQFKKELCTAIGQTAQPPLTATNTVTCMPPRRPSEQNALIAMQNAPSTNNHLIQNSSKEEEERLTASSNNSQVT